MAAFGGNNGDVLKRLQRYQGCHPTYAPAFVNGRGVSIQTYIYEAKNASSKPKGTVVLVHGYGGHFHLQYSSFPGSKFEGSWLSAFMDAGFNVCGLDLMGFGLWAVPSFMYGDDVCWMNDRLGRNT